MTLSAKVAANIAKSLLYECKMFKDNDVIGLRHGGYLLRLIIDFNSLNEYAQPLYKTLNIDEKNQYEHMRSRLEQVEEFKKLIISCNKFIKIVQFGISKGLSDQELSNIWQKSLSENQAKDVLHAMLRDVNIALKNKHHTLNNSRCTNRACHERKDSKDNIEANKKKELMYIFDPIQICRSTFINPDGLNLIIDIDSINIQNKNDRITVELLSLAILLYNCYQMGDPFDLYDNVVERAVFSRALSRSTSHDFMFKVMPIICSDDALKYDKEKYKRYIKKLIPKVVEDVKMVKI